MADKDAGHEILRPNQVCARLDIQPYQLKFWESEFAELGKRVGARREYDDEALQVATDVKRLLVDGRMNLGEAREILRDRYASDEETEPAPAAPAGKSGRPAKRPTSGGKAEAQPSAAAPDEALKRRLKRAEEAALQARQRASVLEAEVEDLRRDAEEADSEARRELLHEKGRATELTKLLDEAQAKIASLEQRLSKERTRSSSGKESVAALESELEAIRSELREARGSREEAEKRLETLNAELLEGGRETETLRRLLREEGAALETEASRLAALAEELLVSLSWAGHPSAEAAESAEPTPPPKRARGAKAKRETPGEEASERS